MFKLLRKVLIFASILYLYFFISPMSIKQGGAYVLNMISGEAVDNTEAVRVDGSYICMGGGAGFYNRDLGVVNSVNSGIEHEVVINKYGYIIYEKVGTEIKGFSSDNRELFVVQTTGYPYFAGDYPCFFVIKSNGMGFTRYNMRGEKEFDGVDYTSIITSLSTNLNQDTIVTTFLGGVFVYGMDGTVKYEYINSNIANDSAFVKSAAISNDGKIMAIVVGSESEVVSVYNIDSKSILFSINKDSMHPYRSFINIVNKDIYTEDGKNISRYSIKNAHRFDYSFDGELITALVSGDRKLMIVSANNGRNYYRVYSYSGELLFQRDYSSDSGLVAFDETGLIIIKVNEYLLRFEMERA